MKLGLVLGGGGVVGIAWEIGVLAGLQRAGVLDPAAVDAVVGTSAGSVVGTRLALGHDLEAMVEEQRAPAAGPAAATGDGAPRPDMSVVMEIFAGLRSAERVTPEVCRVVGRKALAAPAPAEDRWIASFEATLGGAGWPAHHDLRIAAVNCRTGERRIWTAADADLVPLATAVASSCSVPGMFPPVTIGDDRYTDGGVWSGSNADVLVDDRPEAVLFVGPTAGAAAQPGRRPAIEIESEQLRAAGARVVTVTPGPPFAAEIGLLNLMNPAFRARGVDLGIDDGAAAAAGVADLVTAA